MADNIAAFPAGVADLLKFASSLHDVPGYVDDLPECRLRGLAVFGRREQHAVLEVLIIGF